jgi:hypothetical protein
VTLDSNNLLNNNPDPMKKDNSISTSGGSSSLSPSYNSNNSNNNVPVSSASAAALLFAPSGANSALTPEQQIAQLTSKITVSTITENRSANRERNPNFTRLGGVSFLPF